MRRISDRDPPKTSIDSSNTRISAYGAEPALRRGQLLWRQRPFLERWEYVLVTLSGLPAMAPEDRADHLT